MNQKNNKPDNKPSDNIHSHTAELVLYNDDHNTFDHVVESLIKILEFDEMQSEQLALLAHFKGKTTIKTGSRTDLQEYVNQFENEGLNVELQ